MRNFYHTQAGRSLLSWLLLVALALLAGIGTRYLMEERTTRSALAALKVNNAPESGVTGSESVTSAADLPQAPFRLEGGKARWEVAATPLPVFGYRKLEGEGSWSPLALEGRVWLINFWASWCPPCVKELPALNRLAASLANEPIGFLAVNAGESDQTVREFLDQHTIEFPVALGGSQVMSDWSIKGLPMTVVVDATGIVRALALGPREWDDQSIVEELRAIAKTAH